MTIPAQPLAVKVLALCPPVRLTDSMPASVSLPTPVSAAAESVKSTSADSVAVSLPAPPSSVSLPKPPVSVSSPASPVNTLSRAFPTSVSDSAVPTTFSIPIALERVSVKPDTTACAFVTARKTFTPPLASAEKSSVSLSASAASTIVTPPDGLPLNAYRSFPAAPARLTAPAQPSTVNVLALWLPVRLTDSTASRLTEPRPVNRPAESLKSISPDSTTLSEPSPPSNASLPALPVRVSSPASPAITLSWESPRMTSSNADPITLRKPMIDPNPVAVPTVRSTVTAPPYPE